MQTQPVAEPQPKATESRPPTPAAAADSTEATASTAKASPRTPAARTTRTTAPRTTAAKTTAAKSTAAKTTAAKTAAARTTTSRTTAAKSAAVTPDTTTDSAPAVSTPAATKRAMPVKSTTGSTARVPKAAEPVATPAPVTPASPVAPNPQTAKVVLSISGLVKHFGDNTAVDGVALDVHEGSFYGIVGPNGAGKTTTLSMVTGLLRPDGGTVTVHDVNVWKHPSKAKRSIGVLPDRLRLFDRLTGAQLLYYAGTLRGLDSDTVRERAGDLASAFGLEDALNRLVADYSAGMTKKIALAAAMIHSPRLLVLDEPFESVDPVSAANVIEILQKYVAAGGTVVLSSHGMDLIQRVCDSVAIIVQGKVLASGSVDEVRAGGTLEDRFVELAGGRKAAEGMEWLHSFSD